ncbi:MAG TPA: hypothetical protein VKK31_14630 [Thermoanaerobaculia bacterium]|nr:hypothetical protein [Thermoanaerobaculia bacterium]
MTVPSLAALRPAELTFPKSLALFLFAALFEIAGCFSFWAWLRLGRSPWLVLPGVLDFITKERLCCPFFGFALQVEPEGGALWLNLTGRQGVKPFIVAEIGHALDEEVARKAGPEW